ncbi:MAG: terminase family protein [Verrucomicrobia bacterium]|nr:terminase family protein [Verrucomicrobiota bacterium]MDE3098197.1 terminase family protein [Verrucomicrobiota bacterium]
MKTRGNAKVADGSARFLPYQAAWIKDRARLKIAEKSRQIGWTWATAYSLAARKSLKKARLDAWISSRDEIQARLFVVDCSHFARILNLAARDLGEIVLDGKGSTAFVLAFANGLRLHSISSNPDAQAGKRGDRVLDEFALHPDPRRLYAIAYPGITWGGSLEIFSTHRGSANYFNELIEEARHKGNPKGFSVHRVTLEDALAQGFLSRLQSRLPEDDARLGMDEADYFNFIKNGCPDEETFLQEYMCVPGDDNAAFLSWESIAGCEYRRDEAWQADLEDAKGPLYTGVDVGREHDWTVIWVVERLGDVSYTRRVICLKQAGFDAQESALYEILALPRARRCCIDETGIGRQFAERARQRFGAGRVEGVSFTAAVKEELAFLARGAFEDRAVRVPNDEKVRSDLRAIRKETTAAGNVRFQADRGPGGHSDRFWALALALHAAETKQEIWALVA